MTVKAEQVPFAGDGMLTQAGPVGGVALRDRCAAPALRTAAIAMQGGGPFEQRQTVVWSGLASLLVDPGIGVPESQHDGGQGIGPGNQVAPLLGRFGVITVQIAGEEFEPSWRVEPNCTHP